jgi:hypothetical protein
MEHFSLPPDGPVQKHLDALLFPVFVINLYAGTRMITRAVNRSACIWLNKEPVEIIQHLVGNAIGCVHARLAEGCGDAAPCAACEVLRSVAGSAGTGEPLVSVPTNLHREKYDGPTQVMVLKLTTMKAGGLVMMRLDPSGSAVLQVDGPNEQRHE